ncbi:hypothetical protein HN924_03095 [Candidatus Woesearchaeota archaeon]|jgi:hypothetical protein|nr:hypothetical protein [Candidatus Woesearchaeota archaeon]MBT7062929.1 hypothetical protein [Candidatus Woesearchaeota archaeon]MBT7402637.1 hypothetical protein [Candidatus Woesearchaeota archaeon]
MITKNPSLNEGWTPEDTYKPAQLTGALAVSDFGIDVMGETTIQGAGSLEFIAGEVLPEVVEPLNQVSPMLGSMILSAMVIYHYLHRNRSNK